MIYKKLVSIAVATVIGAALITAPALARGGGGGHGGGGGFGGGLGRGCWVGGGGGPLVGGAGTVAASSVQRMLAASAAWAAPGSAAALRAGPASPVERPSSVDQASPDRRSLVDRPLSGGRSFTIAHSLRTIVSHGGRSSPAVSASDGLEAHAGLGCRLHGACNKSGPATTVGAVGATDQHIPEFGAAGKAVIDGSKRSVEVM